MSDLFGLSERAPHEVFGALLIVALSVLATLWFALSVSFDLRRFGTAGKRSEEELFAGLFEMADRLRRETAAAEQAGEGQNQRTAQPQEGEQAGEGRNQRPVQTHEGEQASDSGIAGTSRPLIAEK